MTKKVKSVAMCCLVLVMMFAVTACSSKKKDAEYLTKFQECLDQLTTLNTTLTKNIETYLNSFAEADKTALTATINDVSTAYSSLKAIEAPKGYEEIQALFSEGADKAAPALEIYKKEFGSVTAETFNADFVAKIAEGDKIMEEANQKLIDAGNKIEEKIGATTDKDNKKDDESKSAQSDKDASGTDTSSADESKLTESKAE